MSQTEPQNMTVPTPSTQAQTWTPGRHILIPLILMNTDTATETFHAVQLFAFSNVQPSDSIDMLIMVAIDPNASISETHMPMQMQLLTIQEQYQQLLTKYGVNASHIRFNTMVSSVTDVNGQVCRWATSHRYDLVVVSRLDSELWKSLTVPVLVL